LGFPTFSAFHFLLMIGFLIFKPLSDTIMACKSSAQGFAAQIKSKEKVQQRLRRELSTTREEDYLTQRSLALEPKMTWQQYRARMAVTVLLQEGFL
jgi:hypothetical protein